MSFGEPLVGVTNVVNAKEKYNKKGDVSMALKNAGAMWAQQGAKGEYFSISLTLAEIENCPPKDGKISLLCFPVREKKSEKSPDFTIYRTEDE